MNQGAGFCLLQLRNKWLGTSEPLLQVCGLWAAPSPRPRAGPVLSSPQLPLGIPETDSPSQCYPLFSSSLRTALSALSGMLTPCTCHISSGQEEGGCTGDQGRKSLGPTTWSRFSKWPKVGSSPPRPQCPFLWNQSVDPMALEDHLGHHLSGSLSALTLHLPWITL